MPTIVWSSSRGTEAKLEDLQALRAGKHAQVAPGQAKIGSYALDLGIRNALTTLAWARDTAASIDPGLPPEAPDPA
ncbi:hypothetical protein AB0O34_31475 [Sphaerisporangium sp. NPDC088356]|uniref:hypothetical protein n=1 Tax=Sphaerisporangium sp. NPDC088356 TaxID=3154871 RepID=UPI0034430BD0